MRIVQLANFHGPLSGGIRNTLQSWRTGYRSQGHDVHLVVPGAVTRTIRQHRGAIHEIAAPRLPGGGGYRLITDWSRVARLLSRLEPDVLEVSDRTTLVRAGSWARSRGVRATLVLHERLDNQVGAMLPGWLPRSRLVDVWNRSAARRFDTIVATSAYGTREMSRIGVGTTLVPLGVDLAVFSPSRAARLDDDRYRLAYVGRLSPDKRPDLAIGALDVLLRWGVDAELVMIGEGPMSTSLRRQAARLPVRFTGYVGDRVELAAALSASDVSIVPCPGECFGLAALESLACGTPVVVASNSGAAELIGVAGGMAVPPGPRGFASAVETILSQPRADREAEARSVAEQYPWRRSVRGMLDAHRQEEVAV